MSMNKTVFALALCSTVASHAAAQSEKEIQDLLKASGCMTCHATAEKVVGPSFQAIAAKYAGQADAVDALSQSVRNGSRGKWGRVPMPSHASLSAPDLQTLSAWVLSQKP
jgi:cytochrome c